MLLAAACAAQNISGFIVPPFPEGWKDLGGACIGENLGSNKLCDYSIGLLEKPGLRIFYLGKSATRIDPKKARWLVTDQMPYPKAPAGFHVVYSLCQRNGTADDTIIAMVKITNTEWHSPVRSAYRANLETDRFEKASTKGLRCFNEGWAL